MGDMPALPWNLCCPACACSTQGLSQVPDHPQPISQAKSYLGRVGALVSRAPRDTKLRLAHNQAFQIYYNFRCFLLTHFMATLLPVLWQVRKSSWAPIFPQRGLSPLEFISSEVQLRWGTKSLRNWKKKKKKTTIFLRLCSFPRIWWEQYSLAALFILNRSRAPASLLRNFQTI